MSKCFYLSLIALLSVISCQFRPEINYSNMDCAQTVANSNQWSSPLAKEENCLVRKLIATDVKYRCCWVKYLPKDAETKIYTCEEIAFDIEAIKNREKQLKDANHQNIDIQCSSSFIILLFSWIFICLF